MTNVIVIGALGKMGRTVCDAVMADDDLNLAAAVDPAFADETARRRFGIDGVPEFEDLIACLEGMGIQAGASAGGTSPAGDYVAIDFTIPGQVMANLLQCLPRGVHCVVGTTGISEEELDRIESAAREGDARCFIAPNFAIGAVLMMEVGRRIIRHMPAVEIIELHHDQKLDAPSGTALRTADLLADARGEALAPPGPEDHPARGLVHREIPIHSVRLPGLVAHQEIIFGGKGQTLSLRHDSVSRESFMPGVVLAAKRVAGLEEPLVIGLENIL